MKQNLFVLYIYVKSSVKIPETFSKLSVLYGRYEIYGLRLVRTKDFVNFMRYCGGGDSDIHRCRSQRTKFELINYDG